MKRKKEKFGEMFLIAAWIMFFASDRSIPASVLLILAGIYMIFDVSAMRRKKSEN